MMHGILIVCLVMIFVCKLFAALIREEMGPVWIELVFSIGEDIFFAATILLIVLWYEVNHAFLQ